MKNINWNNVWVNVRLLLIFSLVLFLFAFTQKRNENRKLLKTEIVFEGVDNLFVTHEMVNKLLIENNENVKTIQKVDLDLNKLEQLLDSHKMIEKSQVFVTVDGVLKTVVKQRTPVARYVGNLGSFYIDYHGVVMPISENFTARVPLIEGDVDVVKRSDLLKLLQAIYNDDFLKKSIIGLRILSNGGIIMKDRSFDYDIDFGRTIFINEKFKNYKAFFQKAVADSSLYNYKKINLKFTQQVVCTR